MSVASVEPTKQRTPRTRGGFMYRHVWLRGAAILSLPITWLVLVYLTPLAFLFVTAFWTTDSFTGNIVHQFTFANFQEVFTTPAYLKVIGRTVGVALLVTLLSLIIALPMAFFMARVSKPKWRPFLVAIVLTPLWASYLVKVYAWRTMLSSRGGVISWALKPINDLFGTHWHAPGYGWAATVITLTYLWLPYMILPLFNGLERLPNSMLDASADLGAKSVRTFRKVVWPLIIPSIIAGSIFTFSLSLGDYITVQLVGGTAQMLGSVVYGNFSVNLPLAAAFATIPVMVMVVYLLIARRAGALEDL
jgi:putative spermidine/putrescine transport system permease protein